MTKSLKNLLLLLPPLLLILLGLAWLAGILVFLALLYFCINRYLALIRFGVLRETIKVIVMFLFLIISVVSFKLLVFDIYKIPSPSMENLLFPGDIIVVNKLTYGPKLPQSPFEIPWVNLAFYMNKNARAKIKDEWWDFSRWSGTTPIRQGDVFVFNSIWKKDFIMVKRCVALPGDTLQLINGEVFINHKLYHSPKTVKNNCSFKVKNKDLLYKILDSLEIEGNVVFDNKTNNRASAQFSIKEFELLQNLQCMDSVKKIIDVYDISNTKILKTPTSQWTMDNMGPIVIPKKGMKINLNPVTFMLYRKALNKIEKNDISEKNGSYFKDGKQIFSCQFKLNYYFMIGDNRKETADSRAWGFLPETHIIGKVQAVIYSNKSK